MFIEVIRLGKDAELRFTQTQQQVLNFVGAYDVGYGQNKKTQWIECSLWGDRAAKVADFMKKGQQVMVCLKDVQAEAYQGQNGPGAKLKGTVTEFKFCGPRPEQGYQQAPHPQQAAPQQYQQAPAPAPQPQPGFDDFDEDIPF